MQLFPIHSGKWLKMHFEGGMKAFQEQYQMFYKEWLPQHSEFFAEQSGKAERHCPNNAMTMEWYNGTDIDSPNYQCGVMMPLE
jgi:predicted transcriptional regulator YdeE